jgi:hypothetical protein
MSLTCPSADLDQVTVGGAVNADWKNFENLDASAVGVDDALTVTASAVAGTYVYTGSAGDSVTLGAIPIRAGTSAPTPATTPSTPPAPPTWSIRSDIGGGSTGTRDTLNITSTSVNMNDAWQHLWHRARHPSTAGTTFTADTTANRRTILGSTGLGDTITLGASTQSVSAGTGDDIIVATDALSTARQ